MHMILMNGLFKKVKNELPMVVCNTTAAKEHIGKTGGSIQTIKEQTRGIIWTLPVKYIPRNLKIEFIYFVVLWINAPSIKNGA